MVLLIANLPWHYIEKPTLALRKKLSFVAKVRGIEVGKSAVAAPEPLPEDRPDFAGLDDARGHSAPNPV